MTFTNLVATRDPLRPRQLLLACHLDSKTWPAGFLGATDSAAPCAIALHVAATLEPLLRCGPWSPRSVTRRSVQAPGRGGARPGRGAAGW